MVYSGFVLGSQSIRTLRVRSAPWWLPPFFLLAVVVAMMVVAARAVALAAGIANGGAVAS